MADVTTRSRAQMLLVGALALATIFLLLSLLLNSVIYTENLATRRSNVGADSATTFRMDARTGVGDTIEYANRAGDRNYSSRYADYETNLEEWRRLRSNFSATNGRYTNVTLKSGYEGTRIVDDNASSTMVPLPKNKTRWTVAPDVKSRRLALDVNVSTGTATSASNVASDLSSGDPDIFRVVFDDGTRTAVAVYENSSSSALELLVYDYASGEYGSCEAPNGRVDVFRQLADGQYCDPLSAVSPSGAHDVNIRHGDQVTGTYSLVVDRLETPLRNSSNQATYSNHCTAAFAADDTSAPYTTPAIYSTTVRLEFASVDATYRTTERVAPAERGDSPVDPRFVSLSVNETTAKNFTVTWEVSDPNGDLDMIQTELIAGGNVTETESQSLNGSSANSFYEVNTNESGPYDIVTTVHDDAGNQRTLTERHREGDNPGCPP